ncbi:alpha/beta hydrolase [Pseudohoeflea coraliihabitans]|uniref:Alpha/beta hydrolase n=1 Tax=Pseudohoeflea coraliihabitans TaxID=2860393 RepID=A0ABS6WJ84_9HYPH|nr:alpha/beta hydrolase [Pseudohoeflea sp. DP4N28-3]MBW3096006.1 alpha/beta hydrolase [Pseudohoeflea sp. DP4N28-3]
MHDWQSLDAEEREYQFNPQKSVDKPASSFQAHRTMMSRICRQSMEAHLDVKYGPGPLHGLDIFPAGPDSPVHIFFHGGYWRIQDKENFSFIARDLVASGVTVVIANYDLCPAVTLDGVTASALNAIEWCFRNIDQYGGDPHRMSVSGNSAGAHLCSMVVATDWAARGLPRDIITGAVMISGIFDPTPAMHISVNADLALTEEIIERNNTERLPPKVDCRNLVIAGGKEPWAWIDQSYRYSRHLRQHGGDPEVHILPGYHHFNIMDEYLEPSSPIARAVQAVCGAGEQR